MHATKQHTGKPVTALSQPFPNLLRMVFPRAKHAAIAARVSHRTAEDWWQGRSVMRGDALLNLMAESEAMEAEVLALVRRKRESR